MKRLQSEVKAASEKQQTYRHHRENEGERWWWRRVETDSERHLAEDNLISPQRENTATHQACPPETTPPECEGSHSHRLLLTIRKIPRYYGNLMQPHQRQSNSEIIAAACSFSR